MEKEELIQKIAEKADVSHAEATEVLDAFTDSIKEGLMRGEKVTIAGFGTFSLSKRKAQTFKNPRDQQVYEIPERMHPHFKAGKNLQELLKQ